MLCITNNSNTPQTFVYLQLNDQTVLFQTILFSVSHLFVHSLNVKQFLSGAATSGLSGPESNGNEGVLRISQNSRITGVSPSDCLMSFSDTSWRGSYLSAEMPLVYSPSLANWAKVILNATSYEITDVQPPTSCLWNYPNKMNKACTLWRSLIHQCHVVSHWEDRNMITTILLFELAVASHQRMTVKKECRSPKANRFLSEYKNLF